MIYVYELNAHIKFVMKVLPIVMFHCHIKKNLRMVFLDLIATINISRNVISRWTYQEFVYTHHGYFLEKLYFDQDSWLNLKNALSNTGNLKVLILNKYFQESYCKNGRKNQTINMSCFLLSYSFTRE